LAQVGQRRSNHPVVLKCKGSHRFQAMSMAFTACVFAALAVAAGAVNVLQRGSGFIRGLEFKHRLRVCNAYPYAAALDVFRGQSDKLTGDTPMPYKSCRDFTSPLKSGDKLEFKVGEANAGSFSVSELPSNDAVLLLVIHRHDTVSTAVSFESHVFADLQNSQIAVIDTYRGATKASTHILDVKRAGDKSPARSEELRYDSVVAVNPGKYEVDLKAPTGETKAKRDLVALNHESYVVLRVGVESQQGQSFPEELMVYPQSDMAALHSGAPARSVCLATLATVVMAIAVLM